MTKKYDVDFKPFDVNVLKNKSASYLVSVGEEMIAANPDTTHPVVKDMVQQFGTKGALTDGQINYLASLVKRHTAEWEQYEQELLSWYDSREDIQEVYQYAMQQPYIYVLDPASNRYISKGQPEWNAAWEKRPHNSDMFWRHISDWNVKRFRVIKADSAFEEGDLVELRKPFIQDWRYDPLYDGSNTPPPTDMRLGTVMQMTEEVHRRSRAGKGSRLINIMWMGKGEIQGVPERIIKLHERKRRAKK